MATQVAPTSSTKYLFTVAQFERMIADGIFAEAERVELIDGEIVEMTPISHQHAAVVSNLEFILREKLGKAVYVWAQQPLALGERSRPQPDVAVLRWRDDRYITTPPAPDDVLLVIEVADTSLATDRGVKRARYAEAGIPEYWIVNLQAGSIEVYSDSEPARSRYSTERTASRGEALLLPGQPGASATVDEVLGTRL